jgi:hypothetical protein
MRLHVETAAAGAHLKGARGKWIVELDSDGRNVLPGPGKINKSKNSNSQYNHKLSPCDESRCKTLRVSTKEGGSTYFVQHILEHPEFLCQFEDSLSHGPSMGIRVNIWERAKIPEAGTAPITRRQE